jgi:hypothetical protein
MAAAWFGWTAHWMALFAMVMLTMVMLHLQPQIVVRTPPKLPAL